MIAAVSGRNSSRRREGSPRFLVSIILAGVYVVLAGGLFLVRRGADVNYDGEIYLRAARALATGNLAESLLFYPMPALPALIALAQKLIGDWVQAGRMVSGLCTGLTIWPLYLLGKELFDRKAAFWGCIAFLLLPETLRHSNSIFRETPFLPWMTLAVLYLTRSFRTRRVRDLLFAAAAAVVACLFRIEGMVFFAAAVPFFAYALVFGRGRQAGRKAMKRVAAGWILIAASCAALAVTVAISVPAAWSNRLFDWFVYAEEVSKGSFWEYYRWNASRLEQMQESAPHLGVGQNFAATARAWMPAIYLWGFLQLWLSVITPVNWPFLALGFFGRTFEERHVAVLSTIAGLGVLSVFLFISRDVLIERYLLTPTVLLCPWVGSGLARSLEWVSRRKPWRHLGPVVLLGIVLTVQVSSFDKFFKNPDNLARKTVAWLSENTDLKQDKFAFNDQVVHFHAESAADFQAQGMFLVPAREDPKHSRLYALAREKDVDYLVVEERMGGGSLESRFPGYRLLKQFERKKRVISVYERQPT